MGIDERMFFEFYKKDIHNKSREDIIKWLATLNDEDKIMVHAFALMIYNGRERKRIER